MFEQFFEYFHFAMRQRLAFLAAVDTLKQISSMKIPFTKIGAAFLAVVELFSAAFWDTPRTPRGPALDLSGYELVFEDEFEGDAVNTDLWRVFSGGHSKGWQSPDQLRVKDGRLTITTEYKENGPQGPGWYIGDMALNETYCKGYFEIRCKVFNNTSRKDFWSAFWITVDGELDQEISRGGPGGCEIDVYEAFSDNSRNLDYPVGITPAMWCNGVDDDPDTIDGVNFGQWYANDPVNEYNTYGVLWTDEYYAWYINGVECFRTTYGNGTSQVPEEVRVSMCAPACAEENMTRTREQPGVYVVDYVRIYQPAA